MSRRLMCKKQHIARVAGSHTTATAGARWWRHCLVHSRVDQSADRGQSLASGARRKRLPAVVTGWAGASWLETGSDDVVNGDVSPWRRPSD